MICVKYGIRIKDHLQIRCIKYGYVFTAYGSAMPGRL